MRILAEDAELQDHLRRNLDQAPALRRGGSPARVPISLHDAVPFRRIPRWVASGYRLAPRFCCSGPPGTATSGSSTLRRGGLEPAGPASPRGLWERDSSLYRRTSRENRSTQRDLCAPRSHQQHLIRPGDSTALGRQFLGQTSPGIASSAPGLLNRAKALLRQNRGENVY